MARKNSLRYPGARLRLRLDRVTEVLEQNGFKKADLNWKCVVNGKVLVAEAETLSDTHVMVEVFSA